MDIICPRCETPNQPAARFCQNCRAALRDPQTNQLLPGTVLNERYQITRTIARGGMGVVYEARALNLGNLICVVKALDDRNLPPEEKQEALKNFQREGAMLARLTHPNLPRVFDHFTEGDEHFLVMDLVRGESLEAYLERTNHQPVPLEQALKWMVELCDVLAFLHRQDPPIIFRDLKPGNIMITPDGQVKLIDFGIARFFVPGKHKDTVAYGTPGYSAPEQYGNRQTDPRSDIYSLGVILHELLTGHDPADTPFQLPAVRRFNPQVPEGLERVIERATRPVSDMRYSRVEDMQQALSFQLPGESLAATRPATGRLPANQLPTRPAVRPVAPPSAPQPAQPLPDIYPGIPVRRQAPQQPPRRRSGFNACLFWFLVTLLLLIAACCVLPVWLWDNYGQDIEFSALLSVLQPWLATLAV